MAIPSKACKCSLSNPNPKDNANRWNIPLLHVCQEDWQVSKSMTGCDLHYLFPLYHSALMHTRIFKDKLQVQICSNVWTWCWFILEFTHVCLRQIDGTSSLLLISAQCCLSVTVTERLIKNHQWLIIVWLLLRIWLCKFGCHFYLECLKTGSSQAPSLRMTPTDVFIFPCMVAFKWRSCSFFFLEK